MLLAIDTATHLAAVALMDETGIRDHVRWRTERNHTVELVPRIVWLLERCGVPPDGLRALAVASGPGSYTGLRIGLSVAKGYCQATGAALVAVPTLDITAEAVAPRAGELCAVLQAGRGRLVAGFYREAGGAWRAARRTAPLSPSDLASACGDGEVYFAGEVDEGAEQVLREQLGARAAFAPAAERARDPRVLARLGWARWQAGLVEDLATFAPDYGDNP